MPATTAQTDGDEPWRLPPLGLREPQVDVWCLRADPAAAVPAGLPELLDAQERARAARFVMPEHRSRFILAHGVMRVLLASYLGVRPGLLRFAEGPHGKPRLHDDALAFNLSHSHDMAVLAVGRGAAVGVDVERQRRLEDRDGLVRRFFSTREQADFSALPEADRDRVFFRLWTRKEAYIKALGDGLRHPLDSFAMSQDIPARILEPALPGWSLHHLDPAEGYVGALAVEHPAPQVRLRQLTLIGGRLSELGGACGS